MSKRKLLILAVVVAGGIAWYAFRPERLFVNKTVNESLPTAASAATAPQPVDLESGNFHDGAHKTSGVATVLQLPDGKRALRLTNFMTSNGPDVHVYLVAAKDATDNATLTRTNTKLRRSGVLALTSTLAPLLLSPSRRRHPLRRWRLAIFTMGHTKR